MLELDHMGFFARLAGLLRLPVFLPRPTPFGLIVAEDIAVPADFFGNSVDRLCEMRFLQFALPDDDHCPTQSFQLAPDLLVALLVARHLRLPKFCIGLRRRILLAILVAVPETAVNEDDSVVFGQDYVRGARETLHVSAVTEPFAPERVAQPDFRFCAGRVDGGHVVVALFGCHFVDNEQAKLLSFSQ